MREALSIEAEATDLSRDSCSGLARPDDGVSEAVRRSGLLCSSFPCPLPLGSACCLCSACAFCAFAAAFFSLAFAPVALALPNVRSFGGGSRGDSEPPGATSAGGQLGSSRLGVRMRASGGTSRTPRGASEAGIPAQPGAQPLSIRAPEPELDPVKGIRVAAGGVSAGNNTTARPQGGQAHHI